MGTTSSGFFTGSSQFSTDFQNVISRATAIASLPITQLNTDKTNLSSQATPSPALTAIQGSSNRSPGNSRLADRVRLPGRRLRTLPSSVSA